MPGLFGVGSFFLLLRLFVLAVVAALRADINVVAGQACAQAGVLALVADGQAQLLVGHGHAAGAGLAGQQLYLDHLGGAQGCGDELGDVLAPLDDVDLLAAQLLDHSGHAAAVLADAGRDGVDVGVLAPHGHLGAGTGLAADGLDLHGAVKDLGHFQLKQALDKAGELLNRTSAIFFNLYEAMKNDGLSPMYDQTQLDGIKNNDPHYGNVNWMDEVLSKSGSTDNVFVTLSGGGKIVRYFSSVDYLSYKGFIKPENIVDEYSSQLKYSKLSIRTNVDVDLTKSTLLSFKMSGMLSEHNRPNPLTGDLMSMLYSTPAAAFPVKTPYGDWGGSNVWTRNPVAEVAAKGYARSHQRLLFADMAIRQDLGMFLKGLSVDARIAYDNFCEYWDNYGMNYAYAVPNVSNPSSSEDYTLKGESTAASFSSSLGNQWSRFNLWGRVNYANTWDDHKLNVTLAASREQTILNGQHNTRNRINYDTSDPTLVQDDYFHYKEQIYALYADYNRAFGKQFSMQLGLRMEHTRTTGISESENTTDKHDYTRLFPTLYFLYSPNEQNALNLSLSNRISRPSQNMVNPFPFYQNKYTYARGKEDLKPSYTYNAELGYTFKNNLNISAFYSYSDDVFFQVVGLDPETNISSFLWDNFMETHSFGLNNSYTFRTKWMQAYVQHGVNYSRTTSSAASTSAEEKGWAYNSSLRNTFFLNPKKTFIGTLSGWFTSRQYSGVYLIKPTYGVSAGLLYRMLDNKLSLSLNVNNILISHSKLETVSNGVRMTTDNQFAFTGFRIGVSYTFGGDIRSKGQRNSNSDIQNRL